jgi:hypothetical protein
MNRIRMVLTAAAVTASLCAAAATSASAAATPAGPSKPKAVSPPLVGVNLYVNRNYSLAQARQFGARDLKYIARTLKLKAVSIAWDYSVPTRTSDTVHVSPVRTPTRADLAALTSIARSYGLRVEYRVLYAVKSSDQRGKSIQPKHLTLWLRSLLTAEKPALTLAQHDHVREFIVGTEMASIDQSRLWGGFLAKAARLYHGILSYASWGGPAKGGGFFGPQRVLLPLKYFGASTYPAIDLSARATVAQLTKAWLGFLRQAPERLLRLTAIDEIGIPEVAGAYRAPSSWDGLEGAKPDPAIQANWYKAVCQAADRVHLRAIYFWDAVLSSDPASSQQSLEGFEGHPATLAVIKSCP